MKKRILYFLVLLVAALFVTSCTEEGTNTESINKQTILVFMPWTGTSSGSQGLYPYFKQNLDSIESAIVKAGKMNGCLIEGMGCPGGCMGGAGTNISLNKAKAELKKYKENSTEKVPSYDVLEIELD